MAYFMTHPLMSTQNRPYGRQGSLAVAHIEKAMLLCNCLEVHNGARTRALNGLTLDMVKARSRNHRTICESSRPRAQGRYALAEGCGGRLRRSPGINQGRPGLRLRPTAFRQRIDRRDRARATRDSGAHGGPITIAHSVLKLLYEGGQRQAHKGRRKFSARNGRGPLRTVRGVRRRPVECARKDCVPVALLQHRLRPARQAHAWRPSRRFWTNKSTRCCAMPGFRAALANAADTDARIFLVIKTLVHQLFVHYVESLKHAGPQGLIPAIRESAALVCSQFCFASPCTGLHTAKGRMR